MMLVKILDITKISWKSRQWTLCKELRQEVGYYEDFGDVRGFHTDLDKKVKYYPDFF